ncbi:tetratricopeptide repeat protein [Kutzneria sp. NPDC051319]|uniref:ATP-binding protein n=1 Tax=Kutzneria sp. NPDC051319 TaxID=3155047 RepID=UPI00342D158B
MGDSVVRRFRQRAGLTQEGLAQRSGVSVRTIRGLETGDRPNPQLASLRQLADAMTLSPEDRDELMASVLGTASVPRQLPLSPSGFTGREAELAQLDAAASMVVISAVAGAGGIGKTWLAVRWAHRHLDRFPDGQLFVDLRGFSPDSDPVDPLAALRGFLDALGVDTARVTGDLDEHAARYRSEVAGKRMLIVLDNAATADQVVPLLPGTPTCTVLVTSRRVLSALLHRHGAHHVPLSALDEDEAREFLVQGLGSRRVAAEPAAAEELIEACGRYPLALAIMVSRGRNSASLARLAAELRQHGLDALTNVLSWSLKVLTNEQRTVFALLGTAPGADIGLPAAASLTGLSRAQVTGVLRALTEASLLTRLANGRYAMHDLIRAFAAQQDVAERPEALRRVLDFYLHTANAAAQQLDPQPLELPPPTVDPQPIPDVAAALAWFDDELPNLLAAQRNAVGATVWQLARTMNSFLHRRGWHHNRLVVWQAAVDADVPESRANAHGFLGRAYGALGRFEEATEHFEQALAHAEGDTLQQANTYRMLAAAWEQRGDDRRALEHTSEALSRYRTLDQPVWEADALNSMGWYETRLGDQDAARRHCEEALTMQRRNGYRDGEAAALDSLGHIARHTGRHRESVDYYEQALAIFRDVGNTVFAAVALDGLGHPLAALGRADEARAAWGEALLLFQEQGREGDAERVRRQLDGVDHSTAG